MKKIALLLTFLVIVALPCLAQEKSKAKIEFSQTTYDFGSIREDGGSVTHEFTFTNNGTEPLKIKSARAECGCTKPEFPKEDIAPGESATIKVTYNPLGRPGGFTKVVAVRSNGSPSKVNLKIRGSVVPKK